jgi:tRNA(fMet)-specific endonuclease VapC
MYALDTSAVVDYFRGRGRVAERLLSTPLHRVFLPAVVLYELEVGVEKSASASRRRAELDDLARAVQLLPFGSEEARTAARIRSRLESQGRSIGPYGTLIAATALANGAILVTRNTGELSRVEGLRLEDWF